MSPQMETPHTVLGDQALSWHLREDAGFPAWVGKLRETAFQRFKVLGFPTRREEAWKYVNLDPMLGTAFRAPRYEETDPESLELLENNFLPDGAACRMVFLNGFWSDQFSDLGSLPRGISVGSLRALLNRMPASESELWQAKVGTEGNPFALLNTLYFENGALIHVPENVRVPQPIHILHAGVSSGAEAFGFHPRTRIRLEEGAQADILFEHMGISEAPYWINALVDIDLAPQARLNFYMIQRQALKSTQLIKIHAVQQSQSKFSCVSFTRGGQLTRQETAVDFKGAQASCDLKNLSIAVGEERLYQHALVRHETVDCQSRQLFKNILAGAAQVECNSLVHVVRDAKGSESRQLNRNLLLSEKARVFSRPQLKIYADDVQCSHGSATGRLEDEEIFYLRSRGLDKDMARFILTFGFAEEVLAQMQPEALRVALEALVRGEINHMVRHGWYWSQTGREKNTEKV